MNTAFTFKCYSLNNTYINTGGLNTHPHTPTIAIMILAWKKTLIADHVGSGLMLRIITEEIKLRSFNRATTYTNI